MAFYGCRSPFRSFLFVSRLRLRRPVWRVKPAACRLPPSRALAPQVTPRAFVSSSPTCFAFTGFRRRNGAGPSVALPGTACRASGPPCRVPGRRAQAAGLRPAGHETRSNELSRHKNELSSAGAAGGEGTGRGARSPGRRPRCAPCTWNHGTLPTSVSPGSLTEESPGWRTIGHCVPSAPEGLTRECHADAPDTAGAGRGTVTCPGAWRLAARPLVPGHSLPDHPSWNTNHHPRREGTSRPAKPNKSLYCAIFFYQKVIKI